MMTVRPYQFRDGELSDPQHGVLNVSSRLHLIGTRLRSTPAQHILEAVLRNVHMYNGSPGGSKMVCQAMLCRLFGNSSFVWFRIFPPFCLSFVYFIISYFVYHSRFPFSHFFHFICYLLYFISVMCIILVIYTYTHTIHIHIHHIHYDQHLRATKRRKRHKYEKSVFYWEE